ncbi:hypothetical protein DL98DRAFT_436185, partial [Cadophora sp. DSE1049]
INYELDYLRIIFRVLYYTKDSLIARAEFSYPNTIIVLTCFSYYYSSLLD